MPLSTATTVEMPQEPAGEDASPKYLEPFDFLSAELRCCQEKVAAIERKALAASRHEPQRPAASAAPAPSPPSASHSTQPHERIGSLSRPPTAVAPCCECSQWRDAVDGIRAALSTWAAHLDWAAPTVNTSGGENGADACEPAGWPTAEPAPGGAAPAATLLADLAACAQRTAAAGELLRTAFRLGQVLQEQAAAAGGAGVSDHVGDGGEGSSAPALFAWVRRSLDLDAVLRERDAEIAKLRAVTAAAERAAATKASIACGSIIASGSPAAPATFSRTRQHCRKCAA